MHLLVVAAVLAIVITVENFISTSWVLIPLFWSFHLIPGSWGYVVSIMSVVLAVGAAVLLLRWVAIVGLGVLAVYCFPAIRFGKLDDTLGNIAQYRLAHNPHDITEVGTIFSWLHAGIIALGVILLVAVIATIFRRSA